MDKEVVNLISKLEEYFEGSPWYGDSIMGKLNSIDYRIVNNNTTIFTNSIAKQIQHLINWRIFTIKNIQGDTNFRIELNSSEDWTNIKINSESEWNSLINKLGKTQKEILEILSFQTDAGLDNPVLNEDVNLRYLIEGMIHHDIYHLGQIGLMAKLKKES